MVERVLTSLDDALTAFAELQTSEYTPDIMINSTFGLTDYRLLWDGENGGSVAEDAGTFRLRTGSTANGKAWIETAERGDYSSGSMAIAGLLVFRPVAPQGNEELTWGYYDDNDGFQYGDDSSGFFVRHRVGGVDGDKIRQSDFNDDKLDGTGPSRITLDLSKPHIFRIRMALYGQGPAELWVLTLDSQKRPIYACAHRFGAEESKLLLENWGLPVRAEATNGGDSTSIDLHVGGMQFGVEGKRKRKARTSSETVFSKSLSGTTIVPVISFLKKSADAAKNVRVLGYSPATSNDLQLLVIRDGTLTGASFGSLTNIVDSETALQVDTAATAISGGNAIYEDVITGGGGFLDVQAAGTTLLGQSIPDGTPVTLAARTVSGSGGSLTATFRMEEDW